MNFHLAEVNIAIAKFTYDDPRFAGFVDNLERIYRLAESTPGFVWRHVTVNEDAEAKAAFAEPKLIFNMSVWESKEALRDFVYMSEHVDILRQRGEWFIPQNRPIMALWWQPAGTKPTVAEARHRLDRLAQVGPSEDAFTFRQFYEAPRAEATRNVG
jgi:heme-degrading monooxygenase HmoA